MAETPGLREPSQRVSPHARKLWLLESAGEGVFTLVVVLGAGALWAPFDVRWWMVVLLVAAVLASVWLVPAWKYAVHRWEVTATAVYTQTGWWARERRIAPMTRIQTVDYSEGALERLFGLATVTVTTASAAGALRIAGLDKALAQRLAAELTVRADADPGDAT